MQELLPTLQEFLDGKEELLKRIRESDDPEELYRIYKLAESMEAKSRFMSREAAKALSRIYKAYSK